MRTKRLHLRPLVDIDAQRIAVLAGDWDIARMTARIPYPYTEAMAHQWVSGLEPDEVVRGIDYRGELIGLVGYTPHDKGTAEIGYWIGKPWWGQGFATEAAQGIVRYCFTSGRLVRLSCCHLVDNPGSKRVIEKLGFRLIGPARAYCEARGCEVDTLRYEMKRPVSAIFWRRAA